MSQENMNKIDKFIDIFKGNPERQKKYMELALFKNEAGAVSFQERSSLRRIAIVLTTKCNLRCVWCHRNEDRFGSYLNKEMPFELLESVLPKLKGFSWLHFGGLGEPLLYPRLTEAIREAKRYIPNIRITTNGLLLDKAASHGLIDSGLSCLEVSIDGFDEITNKRCRGSSEDKIIENLKYFSGESDIPIQINTVVADTNYDSLFEAVDKLKDVKNIASIHTIPLFMTNHMQELKISEITPEQHKKLLLHWEKRADALGMSVMIKPNAHEVEFDPVIFLKRKHNICFSVYEDPFINVLGCLSPCGRLQEICLDNIRDLSFDAIWNGPKMIEWRSRQLKGDYLEICQLECHMKNTCSLKVNNC